MKRIAIALVRFYQRCISPHKLTKGCCRFIPTCSEYALEALEVHGFFKGSAHSIWRILRCNPFCKGGLDPVPPKKNKP